jgi:hypothetical protein
VPPWDDIAMDILVAPNGVGVAEEDQRASANPQLLMSLAGVAGELVRGSIEVQKPIQVPVNVVRADDVAIVWSVGPWVIHASDLRAGTLGQFCEMVRKSRAKSALAGANPSNVTIPRYVMSLLARDEGIPVGMIVQHTANPPPLPSLDFQFGSGMLTMWLTSVYANIVARLGEPALRAALATVAQIRASTNDLGTFLDQVPGAMQRHQIVDEEAIACMQFEPWERAGGAEKIRAFLAMIAS